jgi:hypothetical protein
MSEDAFTIKEPRYFSYLDEQHFYSWLQSIDGVIDVAGSSSGLMVRISDEGLSREGLYDLLAIFARYALDTGSIAQFVKPEDKSWFGDPLAYWNNGRGAPTG